MSRTAVWVAAALASVATFAVAVPVKTETVKYQAGDKAMVGYLAYPADLTARRPGVLVVHEW